MILRSLTSRLLVGLVAAQCAAIMIAMLIFPLLAPFVSFDDIAETTFRDRIVRAIGPQADGMPVLHKDDQLARYMAARPNAAFAVFDPRFDRLLDGSDPKIGRALLGLRPLFPRPDGNLVTSLGEGAGTLIVTTSDTPFGRLVFATTGNQFQWEDLPSVASAFMPAILPLYGPVVFGALVLIPLVVSLITRPLRRLAAEAARIGPGALEARLPESGLGEELLTLSKTINTSLARIEDYAGKQRLYAANAAHELRTPIAILSAHIDELPESAAKAALQFDVTRIAALVEQLVTVSRLGQNHAPLDEKIDLAAIARAVIGDRAPIAIRNRRHIEFQAPRTHVLVLGNRQALASAIANLIDNALRAEPPGGAIIVKVGANAAVEVSDHGPGVDPADRAYVFEPFWRKSETTVGAGLGLAIVKEIATRHRGSVDIVDSEGGGATFRLQFPSFEHQSV